MFKSLANSYLIIATKGELDNEFYSSLLTILSEEERKARYEATVQQMEQYDFKMHTLRDVIMYKRGELSFELPAGVECLMTKQPEENKGVKAFVKRILNGVRKQQ